MNQKDGLDLHTFLRLFEMRELLGEAKKKSFREIPTRPESDLKIIAWAWTSTPFQAEGSTAQL